MASGFGWIDLCPHSKTSGFAAHLREGHLVAARCRGCGKTSVPPRADCPDCGSGDFEFVPIDGAATVATFTTIAAAPAGFESRAPYTIGVVDLRAGGRLLAWFGESVRPESIEIGMEVRIDPHIEMKDGEERVLYTLEHPGTGGPTA